MEEKSNAPMPGKPGGKGMSPPGAAGALLSSAMMNVIIGGKFDV